MAGDDLQTEHRAKKPSTHRDRNLRPCLQVLSGEELGKVFVLEDGPSIIGRGATAQVRIEDGGISREHAKVIVSDDLVSLRDLESTNGTYLDGAPVDVAIMREVAALVAEGLSNPQIGKRLFISPRTWSRSTPASTSIRGRP